MTENTSKLEIKLRAKGGAGQSTNWHWEIVNATGEVVKSGSAVGVEARAFTTARVARDKLVKAEAKAK
ncbi:hypothetical protein [Devosia sp.]|uniref:hypothetical protein n=1 Tax=Devosia sp. TaxID=1871048 RepID=UPI0032673B8A